MGRASPLKTDNPSEVVVGIFEAGKEKPVEVLREPVPEGFPPELRHHLAEFLARGFNAGGERQTTYLDLSEFAEPILGRRPDAEVQQIGDEAAKLRTESLTWGQIAKRLCPKKGQPTHRCGKKCADRIRQAAQPYLEALKPH